jgi:hypothetical protein
MSLFRYGGWDGKKWLSDVYIMDTSRQTTSLFHSLLWWALNFSLRWQRKCKVFISCILYSIVSLEWTELAVTGSMPPPRCGHSATMIEKRLLIFGGRGDCYFLISFLGSSKIAVYGSSFIS